MRYIATLILFSFSYNIASAQWQGFEVKQIVETNQRMYTLTLAHVDGDDFPDLVTLPIDAYGSAQIYRGNGDDLFTYTSSLQKDENYRTLVAGDIDHDGIDDLVISGYWLNGFKIFWGNASGQHTESQHYSLTGHGKNVELTDINLDGALDIVAFSGGSGQPITMHLFYGNNSRTMTAGGIYPSGLHTDKRVTVVDKDKNGLPDLMVASSFPWFVIFYQQPGGKFTPRYWPYQLEMPFTSEYHLVDLNNDGKEDIVANYMDEGFRFYEGKNDTLFSEQYIRHNTDIKPYRMFFTDLNKDGFIDIVTDHQDAEYEFTDRVYYFLGNGDFTFHDPKVIQLPGILKTMLVEDFNNDGLADIITSCVDKGIVTILNAGIVTGAEEGEDVSVSVFPNPFSDRLQVKTNSVATRITIYDSKGSVVESVAGVENKTFDTSGWRNGLYILKMEKGKHVRARRIVRK
jgi:hypothetical protein